MPEDLIGRNVVDDKDKPAAAVGIRPVIEPFRREHRVLRRLHDGRSAGPVGELDDAFDAQQVVAAVARQPAEGTGEFEPPDRAFQRDGKHGDSMAVRMLDGAAKYPLSPAGGEGWGEGATGRGTADTLTLARLRRGPLPLPRCRRGA
jgi:hypothetical protein